MNLVAVGTLKSSSLERSGIVELPLYIMSEDSLFDKSAFGSLFYFFQELLVHMLSCLSYVYKDN